MNNAYIVALMFWLTACNTVSKRNDYRLETDSFTSKNKQVNTSLVSHTSRYVWGYSGLRTITYPKRWEADPAYYGGLKQPQGLEFERITHFYDSIHTGKALQHPECSQPKYLELKGFFDENIIKQIQAFPLGLCLKKLSFIGRNVCYYFYSKNTTSSGYCNVGSLVVLDTVTKKCTKLPVFVEASGDQHIMYRFFYIDKNKIRLFDAYYYDDGCTLNESYEIIIETNEEIQIKNLDETK